MKAIAMHETGVILAVNRIGMFSVNAARNRHRMMTLA